MGSASRSGASAEGSSSGLSGLGPIDTIASRWVETDADLAEISQRLRAPGEIPLDTEGDTRHHHPKRLSLIHQPVPPPDVWLVNPPALDNLPPPAPGLTPPSPAPCLHPAHND